MAGGSSCVWIEGRISARCSKVKLHTAVVGSTDMLLSRVGGVAVWFASTMGSKVYCRQCLHLHVFLGLCPLQSSDSCTLSYVYVLCNQS